MSEIPFDASMLAELSDEFSTKLGELNHQLIEVEDTGGAAAIGGLFRTAHSLKGLAALAGMRVASAVTHQLETVFERIRSGTLQFSRTVTDAAFSACDHLHRLLEDFIGQGDERTDVSTCLAQLEAAAGGQKAGAALPLGLDEPTPPA